MSKSNKKKKYRYGMDRRTQFQLQAMMLPATLLVLLFCIVPLFGILIAVSYTHLDVYKRQGISFPAKIFYSGTCIGKCEGMNYEKID